MSDARWLDVQAGLDLAEKHLEQSQRIGALPAFDPTTFDGYVHGMALMHSMQLGYTTIESVLLDILDILGEDRPTGQHWHIQLLDRMARPVTIPGLEREAILGEELARDLKELCRFRHRAMHSYDEFQVERAGPATQAAGSIRTLLRSTIEEFRRRIDPAPASKSSDLDDGPS